MIRSNLITGIAAALGAMVMFTSAAQACISCEYVPEVVQAPRDSDRHTNRPEASHAATIELRQRMARGQAGKAQMAKMQAAKMQAAKMQAAKSRAAAAKTIETASLADKVEEAPAKPRVVEPVSDTKAESVAQQDKPISTATLLTGQRVFAEAEAEPAKPIECKKFVAAVGATVTVPCK